MQPNSVHPIQTWWKNQRLAFTGEAFADQLHDLFSFKVARPKIAARAVLYIVAALTTPISLAGSLIGYVRGYKRFMYPKGEHPRMHDLPRIVKAAMLIGGLLIWIVLFVLLKLLVSFVGPSILQFKFVLLYVGINLALSIPVFVAFKRWRNGIVEYLIKSEREASATTAGPELLQQYSGKPGFYIGNGLTYAEKGHLLLVASARSGKSENIIVQNLLGLGGYSGSWVVMDPKGELAAVTANRMRELGRRVVVLNPWDLLQEQIGKGSTYNPLDILADKSSPHLTDDIQLLAELICPAKEKGDGNEFFSSSARNILASLLLQIAVTQTGQARSLTTLWEWCRKSGKGWDMMIVEMATSKDPVHSRTLRSAAAEIVSMMQSAETFSSIMAYLFETTNFLKSNALQQNLASQFDPYSLADGNTVVYVVCPSDKLRSHANWLRLVVTTLMRAVVRAPKERVCFLCDEAASLGYISEFETCLATYAGYNITLWPIYQDLSQIKDMYGERWETMIANTSVKIGFGFKSNFDTEYFSDMCGDSTFVTFKKDWMGSISDIDTNSRKLFTPDEVRRQSRENMFVFIAEHPVAIVPKRPYYLMPELKRVDGKNAYDPNPYIANSL